MGLAPLLVVTMLLGLSASTDYCLLGTGAQAAFDALHSRGHRVAVWSHDEDASRALLRRGAISSFDLDSCVTFGAAVGVCEDNSFVRLVNAQRAVLWLAPTTSHRQPGHVLLADADGSGPEAALAMARELGGAAMLLGTAGLAREVMLEDSGVPVLPVCPAQNAHAPATLWTRRVARAVCPALVVCHVMARLADVR